MVSYIVVHFYLLRLLVITLTSNHEFHYSSHALAWKQRTVCHEISHFWFGNLVTPEFWTQLWLKEGAARYLEFVAIDRLFPQWHAWELFTQGVYGVALNLDAMVSSHPVEVPVKTADEIGEIFDLISYGYEIEAVDVGWCYAIWFSLASFPDTHPVACTTFFKVRLARSKQQNCH